MSRRAMPVLGKARVRKDRYVTMGLASIFGKLRAWIEWSPSFAPFFNMPMSFSGHLGATDNVVGRPSSS